MRNGLIIRSNSTIEFPLKTALLCLHEHCEHRQELAEVGFVAGEDGLETQVESADQDIRHRAFRHWRVAAARYGSPATRATGVCASRRDCALFRLLCPQH